MNSTAFPGLTSNQLKLIALVTMTIDHIGMMLLPRVRILRAIGRAMWQKRLNNMIVQGG